MMDAVARRLPAVHSIVEASALTSAVAAFGRPAVVRATRQILQAARDRGDLLSPAAVVARVAQALDTRPLPFRAVINATGVLLHTNLGRAPLPDVAWEAMAQARRSCDLELDLDTGQRASRLRHVATPLCALTGAEAGFAVNNNAAAVLLAVAALAGQRPTAVSRGHLLEIGGGFRLPDILTATGSPLLEIGTTNRTHLADYARAIEQGAGLILLVHRANFVMRGYVKDAELAEVAALGRAHNIPVVLDLGSGALYDTTAFGLPPELTVQAALATGLDAVCFSGDKLLGGPQAGLVVGRQAILAAMQVHPLARAVRCDKLQLAALVATLALYSRAEAARRVPLLQLLGAPASVLASRANAWREALGQGAVIDAAGAIGGGALPEATLPGHALALQVADPPALLARLRRGPTSVMAHIAHDRVLLHPRTVFPEEDVPLILALRAALSHDEGPPCAS